MKLHPRLMSQIESAGLLEFIDDDKFKNFFLDLNQEYSTNEMLKTVMDSTPCTISWINKDLEYLGANKSLLQALNLPKNVFVGTIMGDLTKDSAFLNFAKNLFESENEEASTTLESRINGKLNYYYVVARKYNQGTEAVLIGTDVTSLKEMEENNIFSAKLATLGEMSASIIHEINNPLSVIKASNDMVEFMLEDYADGEEFPIDSLKKTLKSNDTMVDQISKIIQGLKRFSRKGGQEDVREVNLKDILSQSQVITSPKVKKSGVVLKIDDFDISLIVNEVQFTQVFVNLINNAVDAMEGNNIKNKWIEISAKEESGCLVVSVTDAGLGIPAEVQTKMFEPFFSTKPIGVGTGMGLSIIKKIVQKHNGEFFIDNQKKNTCFVVKVPLDCYALSA